MKTTKLLAEDLRTICANIDAVAGHMLYPTIRGLWLPHATAPVIEEGQPYFIDHKSRRRISNPARKARVYNEILLSADEAARLGSPVNIDTPDQITGDVYNTSLVMVLPYGDARFLRAEPSVPPLQAALVKACAQQLLDEFAAWRKPGAKRLQIVSSKISFAKTITPYLQPQYVREENIAVIEDQLLGLAKRIITFIGDDTWIMHFVDQRGSRLTIEKTIDYRIFDWMRTHNLSDEE